MPFPFAAVGAIIASAAGAVGGAVATGAAAVATGAAAAGAAVAAAGAGTLAAGLGTVAAIGITAKAISAHNEKKRREAEAAAERDATRERERIALEKQRKLEEKQKALFEEYGEEPPKEKAEGILEEKAELLGTFEGLQKGFARNGETLSSEAEDAKARLNAAFNGGELKRNAA